jgi:hypothetical protein
VDLNQSGSSIEASQSSNEFQCEGNVLDNSGAQNETVHLDDLCASRAPRDVEKEAEMTELSDLEMLRYSLNRVDRSHMSKVMASWSCDGVSRVTVVPSSDAMSHHCDAIRCILFDDRCVPKNSKIPFEKVFGKKMPENENDVTVQSSRLMTGFESLGEEVHSYVRRVQLLVTACVR